MKHAVLLFAVLSASACQVQPDGTIVMTPPPGEDAALAAAAPAEELVAHYSARSDLGVAMLGIDLGKVDPAFHRQVVRITTKEAPGSILVDTGARFLYLVQSNGTAIRYGVAVGREGFEWSGAGTVGRKAVWPRWTPPPEMIGRKPELARWADGMPGGPDNPLGARALYIHNANGFDTQYRIHGTNEPASIGQNASSGCIRMFNQDVADLFARVQPGAVVKVF